MIAGTRRAFRATAPAALAVADVQLAELAQIGPPVADVEHHRLVDPQPQPAPQRRREIVTGRGQVLAGLGTDRRHSANSSSTSASDGGTRTLPNEAPDWPVELVDRLLDHEAGQGVDVALIAADHELEEQRQRPALPARVDTLRPARRWSAKNRSASSHVADHNGPPSERANSMTIDRVLPTCPSLRPAAAIANAYWSTISCSKSSTSSAVSQRPRRADVANRGQIND